MPAKTGTRNTRSPLTEPGVNVKEGDYLVAINGRALRSPETPDEMLVNTANEVVTFTVNSKPSAEGARKVVVKPIANEFSLRELNMIATNRKKVDAASGGSHRLCLHSRHGRRGAQQIRQAVLPANSQGRNHSRCPLQRRRLRRPVDFRAAAPRARREWTRRRNWESGTVPPVVFHGHMVCITNHYAASDGDIFSYFFKQYKLGPLIGERTWGGVRGIRGQMPLMDGGYITRPEFARYGLDSKWVIENRGVSRTLWSTIRRIWL